MYIIPPRPHDIVVKGRAIALAEPEGAGLRALDRLGQAGRVVIMKRLESRNAYRDRGMA